MKYEYTTWACACGQINLRKYRHCVSCGLNSGESWDEQDRVEQQQFLTCYPEGIPSDLKRSLRGEVPGA